MNEPIALVHVEPSDDGTIRVLAPAVGWWSEHPHRGALVGPGSRVGVLQTLNRRYALVLPESVSGHATEGLPQDRRVQVEYGQTLFLITPVHAGENTGMLAETAKLGHPEGADLPEDSWAVVSPSDGVFYRRASPDAATFVEVGDRIVTGQAIGLVEVMKTFNQILFGGPGFPEEGTVVEIRAEDAEEIRSGQILVVVQSR
ncbi:MAG: biotin/lipoyl-containing protein [Acidobacteriota bacterium]|nr:biotin/lipoyl-containing protein [Acidobacteriota bacterium]